MWLCPFFVVLPGLVTLVGVAVGLWLLLGLFPVGLLSVGLDPVELEPVGLEPVGLESVGLEPVELEPVGLEPVGLEPVGLEPVGLEPVGLEPVAVLLYGPVVLVVPLYGIDVIPCVGGVLDDCTQTNPSRASENSPRTRYFMLDKR